MYRSVRTGEEENAEEIRLFCTACNTEYKVQNSEAQRKQMTTGRKRPYAEEALRSCRQLGVGDVFGYRRQLAGYLYYHTMLRYYINLEEKLVYIIELLNDKGNCIFQEET